MADFTENIKNIKRDIIEVLTFISNKEAFDKTQNILYYLDFQRELLERIYGFKRLGNVPWFKNGINKVDWELVFTLFIRTEDLFLNKEFKEVCLTPEYLSLKLDIDKALSTLFI